MSSSGSGSGNGSGNGNGNGGCDGGGDGRRGADGYRFDEEIPTLYVRQVHYSARPDDLRAVFERIGPVRDVYIPLDYYTRESRGFAYVKYEFTRDAEDALRELNGASILGRRIEVGWAEGQRKTRSEMRARDSYGLYFDRARYRSRSPYRRSSYYGRSKRRSRSCSRRRSHSSSRHHSRSRLKPRTHISRRQRSRSRRHHHRHKSRKIRSSKSSSHSVQKNHDKGRKNERSKSPSSQPSSPHSLIGDRKRRYIKENLAKISSKSNSANKLAEAVIEELEMRSEERASDDANEYVEDIDPEITTDGENSVLAIAEEAGAEAEEDKGIEIIDEIVVENNHSIILTHTPFENNKNSAARVKIPKIHKFIVTDNTD